MSTAAALPNRSPQSGHLLRSRLPLQPGRPPAPATGTVRGLSLLPVADGLWRVVTRSGAVLGHIERSTDGIDERFAARRLLASTRTTALGTFWNIDDAADCFR